MDRDYLLTDKGEKFLEEFWNREESKLKKEDISVSDILSSRDKHSGSIISFETGMDEISLNYCIANGLIKTLNVDNLKENLFLKVKQITDSDLSQIMTLYTRLAFDLSSEGEDERLYGLLDKKLKEAMTLSYNYEKEEERSSEWYIYEKEEERSPEWHIWWEDRELHRRFHLLKEERGTRIACDFVINRIHHNLEESGNLKAVLFSDDSEDGVAGSDYGASQDILETLSTVQMSNDKNLNYCTGYFSPIGIGIYNPQDIELGVDYDPISKQEMNDMWEKRERNVERNSKILERNSEHRLKMMKNKKQVQEIKKHTIRKSIGF